MTNDDYGVSGMTLDEFVVHRAVELSSKVDWLLVEGLLVYGWAALVIYFLARRPATRTEESA